MNACTLETPPLKTAASFDHLSFSSIKTYQSCPRKFAFKYMEKRPEEFTPSCFTFGGAFHRAVERVHESAIAGGACPQLDELLDAFERGVSFVASTAEAFEDSTALKGLLSRLDDKGYDARGQPLGPINPTVLFVDEAHRMNRQSQELLYAAVEDRVLDTRVRDPLTGLWKQCREWVPAFTLVCASNRPGDLTASFRDRLRLELRLELYDQKDSTKIVRQAFMKLGLKCGSNSAALVAARGRGVPRKLIGLCEHVRDIAIGKGKTSVSGGICIKAFEAVGIDTLGLTRQDVDLLRHLAVNAGQPLGVKTLAALIYEDERALEENIEPFLLSKGLLARTPRGRAITQNGIEHLRQHHGWKANGRSLA